MSVQFYFNDQLKHKIANKTTPRMPLALANPRQL